MIAIGKAEGPSKSCTEGGVGWFNSQQKTQKCLFLTGVGERVRFLNFTNQLGDTEREADRCLVLLRVNRRIGCSLGSELHDSHEGEWTVSPGPSQDTKDEVFWKTRG